MKPKVWNMRDPNKPKDAVYVGRGSPYGNPYVIGKDGDRNQVCRRYDQYLQDTPKLQKLVKKELKGKDLVCFCAPRRCHGDTLLLLANQ